MKIKLIKILKYALILGFCVGVAFYAITCKVIFDDVRSICDLAQGRFAGDAVEATIALLQSDSTSFELKNDAVYALGQIGDKRALSALQDQITGIPCEKPCPKNKYVCQYNLETAIRSCRGGFSLTRWMYRFL